jgi:hypothetical protein
MTRIEELERQIQRLSAEELAEFRQWYLQFDNEAWDAQMDADVRAGKLDALADEALKEHQAGRSSAL